MAKTTSKYSLAAATCAVAVATALTPLPAAQATPAVPAPSALGNSLCLIGIGEDCEAAAATEFGGLFYLGARDNTPPSRTDFFTFNPVPLLALLPFIGPPLAGWFATLNFEVCVAGLSGRIGPYGTVTASIGSSC